jgi:hypothetical protein
MSDIKNPAPTDRAADEQDVEGHNMWIGPTVMRDLSRDRSKELERQAKEHRRAKEAKGR